MNPIPNGDIYLQPMNYLEAGKEPPAPKPAPAIAAPTPDAPKPGEDTQALLFDPQQFSPTDFVCATPPRKRAKRKPNGHATP